MAFPTTSTFTGRAFVINLLFTDSYQLVPNLVFYSNTHNLSLEEKNYIETVKHETVIRVQPIASLYTKYCLNDFRKWSKLFKTIVNDNNDRVLFLFKDLKTLGHQRTNNIFFFINSSFIYFGIINRLLHYLLLHGFFMVIAVNNLLLLIFNIVGYPIY